MSGEIPTGARYEEFAALPSTVVYGLTTVNVYLGAPPSFVVDRLEVYDEVTSSFDVEVFVISRAGGVTSLFGKNQRPPAASTFAQGNRALFNRDRLTGENVGVTVTNLSATARMFRATLFGESRPEEPEAVPETESSGAVTKVEKL